MQLLDMGAIGNHVGSVKEQDRRAEFDRPNCLATVDPDRRNCPVKPD